MGRVEQGVNELRPPIVFAATSARFVRGFPEGPDELWIADMKAFRCDAQCEIFTSVLFVESAGTAFIYGIEFEDGYPIGLKPEALAFKQQAFIRFLRDETQRENDSIGLLAGLFTGHEYSSEGKATAAYVAARGVPLVMGIGYRNNDGTYELISIDPQEDGWLDSAGSFDELGQPDH